LLCFTLNLGFRLDVLLVFLFKRFLPSRRSRGAGILCWPQTFKELKLSGIPSVLSPRSLRKRVQKYSFLSYARHFIENIFLTTCILLIISI
jgi:hypothetical protein